MTNEQAVPLLVQRLDPDLPLPTYAHPGDAGADLLARTDVTLEPGARATVATGIAIALPDGYAAFVHPRSGLAARHGVTILNGPGTVDAGYRGEVKVTLVNTDASQQLRIRRGDRIAQLVVQRVERAEFVEVSQPAGFGPGERRPRLDRRVRHRTAPRHTSNDVRRRAVSLFKRGKGDRAESAEPADDGIEAGADGDERRRRSTRGPAGGR